MAYDRRSFAGAGIGTTLAGSINSSATTISIAAATNWPDGSGGNFFVVIDRGATGEEKVLIATRSTTTLTVAGSGRGSDGTSAGSHSSGATIELCLAARDLDEANAHIATTALDHHTQYLNAARHDIGARHLFGSALGTPGAASDVGTAASAGSGAVPARSDHIHKIGTGAINSSGMFGAGVVDAAALAANSVGTSELADNSVDTAALQDGSVTTAKLASGGPRGFLNQNANTGSGVINQGSGETLQVSQALLAAAGRYHSIAYSFETEFAANTSQQAVIVKIKCDSTVLVTRRLKVSATGEESHSVDGVYVDIPTAGPRTYTITATHSGNANSSSTYASVYISDAGAP